MKKKRFIRSQEVCAACSVLDIGQEQFFYKTIQIVVVLDKK